MKVFIEAALHKTTHLSIIIFLLSDGFSVGFGVSALRLIECVYSLLALEFWT